MRSGCVVHLKFRDWRDKIRQHRACRKALFFCRSADYGEDVARLVKTLKASEPPVSRGGIKVLDIDTLVTRLKEMEVA